MFPGYEQNADNVWPKDGPGRSATGLDHNGRNERPLHGQKRAAVRAALVADPKYDENPIPVTP